MNSRRIQPIIIVVLVCLLLPSVAWTANPQAGGQQPKVGAYYYPWHGREGRPNPDEWQKVMRHRLVPSQQPAAGMYASTDPNVIAAHIAQSRRANINFWAVSWWGPDSSTDRAFREHLLEHPRAGELKYAVLYESTGRFGRGDDPHYDNWISDLEYLNETYFGRPEYLRIDGRPVLFVYLTRVYFRDTGHDAIRQMREKFPEIYIIGDDVFGPGYKADWAKQFDAVTAYDVYGQSLRPHGATRNSIAALADIYTNAKAAANSVGTAFVPAVAPGYNDTAVRDGHAPAPRYFTDAEKPEHGEVFRAMIRDAAMPNLDSTTENILMVTSFNEWYEDTQIEPTAGTEKSTSKDDSKTGTHFTGGYTYEDYGNLYLDILAEMTK